MIPAQHVRVALTQYKKLGIPFEIAWIKSVRSIPKPSCADSHAQQREWIEVLKWAKEDFRAAYEGQPSSRTSRQQRSLEALADSPLALAA